ncbi:hypothetical protein GCM10010275_09560 [Streptomyces litmocidini]|nr:hypothetical protein GCM10010275_09560 [Streptomyces litmocidini]
MVTTATAAGTDPKKSRNASGPKAMPLTAVISHMRSTGADPRGPDSVCGTSGGRLDSRWRSRRPALGRTGGVHRKNCAATASVRGNRDRVNIMRKVCKARNPK